MDAMIFLISGVAIGYGVRSWLDQPPLPSTFAALELGGRWNAPRVMPWETVPGRAVVDPGHSGVPKASRVHPYPTLASIDQAMSSPHVAFVDHPGAPMLEQRARELVEMYWSDSVWLTGLVDDASLAVVVGALEAYRADA